MKDNKTFPFSPADVSFWMHYEYKEEKYPLFFVRLRCLTPFEKIQLLQAFDRFYGDTDQETTVWALEYQLLTRNLINGGKLLVNPKYLDISEKETSDLIREIIPEYDRNVWDAARRCSREDIWEMFQNEKPKQLKKKEAVLNTKITYLYRDASNYKVWNEAVIKGKLTDEQQKTILECLIDGEYFIPSQVGLPEEKFASKYEDDPVWFELSEGFAEPSIGKATEDLTADELVQNFLKAKGNWNLD